MPARLGRIGAILTKDLRTHVRDRFYVTVTVLSLAAYIAIFWVLPATVDETVGLGVYLPGGEGLLEERTGGEDSGFEIVSFDSSEALASAVERGDAVVAGMDFPDGFLADAAAGVPTTVTVLLGGDAPAELRPVLVSGVREIVATIAGRDMPVTVPQMQELVLGPDRVGQQVSLRERLRPLLVFLVLVVEMLALASLVAAEIAQRTVTAVLVTPAGVGDLLAAKALLGTALAFSQAALLAVATGMLATGPPLLLLLALLLGAVLVTGFGLIAGSTGRDFIGVVFWSMLFIVPLTVPALATLFPGSAAGWVQGLPTYGLVQTIVGVTAYGQGWADTWPALLGLAAWGVVAFGVGVMVLGKRAARA